MISVQSAQGARGDRVKYRLPDPTEEVRQGVITGVGVSCVFVRFDGDTQSILTNPEYLEWVEPH